MINTILTEVDALKAKLSTIRPLPNEAIKKIQDAIEIEYTYDSNRIEGNTLTLQETALVVNEGVTISGKSMREHLEAINHSEAIDFIKGIAGRSEPISERTIKDIHAIVLHGIDRENAGKYRTVPVMISGSRHIPPAPYKLDRLMEDFITEYRRKEEAREHPVLIAAYLHDELVRIHPFIDGNRRTSRLLMNLFLLRHGYTLVSLKSDNEAKVRYYESLKKSHTEGISNDFNLIVATAVRDSLKRYLEIVL